MMNQNQNETRSNEAFRGEIVDSFYFSSLEWMRIALSEFVKVERDRYLPILESKVYAPVVAQVCFGYALEFANKALLLAQDAHFKPTHRVAKLHAKLPEAQRSAIECLALECVDTEPFLGFPDTQTMTSILAGAESMTTIKGIQVIQLIDRYCSDENVKYGGFDARLNFHDFTINVVETRRIEQLRRLHGGILQLTKELLLPDSEDFPTLAEVQLDD